MNPARPIEIPRRRIQELYARERERFKRTHARSRKLGEAARRSLLSGVPMNWMTRWVGDFPIFVQEAKGAQLQDVDGNSYVDFCLGDTGAMTGHSPEPTVRAIVAQAARGITTMLPSEAGITAGDELRRRFGLPHWQFSLSATDANRFVVRLARQITGRSKVLVHNHCYHGSVDETVVALGDGRTIPRHGNVGPPVNPELTTRVVEINDVEGLEGALAHGDVACALLEPALTNIGIVLPEPGYNEAVRQLTRKHGTLLVIDETHTLCCGPGGYTRANRLKPDFVTLGKPIASGVPTGAYGMTDEVADQVLENTVWEAADVGGVGGTLAGNALSLAAVAATLRHVLTDDAFQLMIDLGERFESGVNATIVARRLPWNVTRLGCRVEYMFGTSIPRTGAAAAADFDAELDALLHLYMLNRGILMTPFHMMALMCPETTVEQVDRHTAEFDAVAAELTC
jgi:glutamate-1-semialdehyde 2,1-aminomutase